MRKIFLSSLLLVTLFIGGCSWGNGNTPPLKIDASGDRPPAMETLQALKENNFVQLATIVNSEKGLRLSPYTFVNAESDMVLKPADIEKLGIDTEEKLWGNYDGSGEEIRLTGKDYFAKFVYDQDFVSAPQVSVNERIGSGNSIDNSKEIYPDAQIWEYHFSGFDKQYEGLDWESLRLVFQKIENRWRLLGIIHDAWTI
ncbi:MAG: hypothetical protein PHO48_01165 [Candidatus Gracilibacteria bacterium]|nr:hypothetical protein [Candidatus Gracilibacteria bacterium]MDD5178813.1 hypothetical protein [Candidatus Gracilibacteria bacterium]